jgi:hypothetical protein
MLFNFLLRCFFGLVKFIKNQQVVERCLAFVIGIGPAFLFLDCFQDLFRFFRIAPETGCMCLFFFFCNLFLQVVNVKGTSSALRAAL